MLQSAGQDSWKLNTMLTVSVQDACEVEGILQSTLFPFAIAVQTTVPFKEIEYH